MNKDKLTYRKSTRAVVIDDKNDVLLIQKHRFKDNQWTFPGGGVEEGESDLEAVLRELLEETKFNAFEAIDVGGRYKYDWPDEIISQEVLKGNNYKGQEVSIFLVKFVGSREDLIFQEEEIRSAQWVPISEVEARLLFPELLEGFRKAVKLL